MECYIPLSVLKRWSNSCNVLLLDSPEYLGDWPEDWESSRVRGRPRPLRHGRLRIHRWLYIWLVGLNQRRETRQTQKDAQLQRAILKHHVTMYRNFLVIGWNMSLDSIGWNVLLESIGGKLSLDSIGWNLSLDSIGWNMSMDSIGWNLLLDFIGWNVSLDSIGWNMSMDSIGLNLSLDRIGWNVSLDSIGWNLSLDSIG